MLGFTPSPQPSAPVGAREQNHVFPGCSSLYGFFLAYSLCPMNTEKIKYYIDNHLDHIRKIQDVADHFDMSGETLRRTFRRAEGVGLSRFITQVRVEKAKALLRETDLLCFEVCFAVGFQREDTGAKVFKRVAGCTMEAWRRQNRQPKRPTGISNRSKQCF